MSGGPPLKVLEKEQVEELVRCLDTGERLVVLSARVHVSPVVIKRNIVRVFGVRKYQELIDSHCTYRFKKGFEPWNKGLKGFAPWLKEYAFKKGHLRFIAGKRWRPVGTILIWKRKNVLRSGVLIGAPKVVYVRYIKVSDVPMAGGKNWVAYARYVWEKEHGTIPKGMNVIHLDRNTLNDVMDNFALMTPGQVFRYLDARYPEYKEQRVEKITAVLSRLKKVKPKIVKRLWECTYCEYQPSRKIGRCPKCGHTSFERIIIRQKVIGGQCNAEV